MAGPTTGMQRPGDAGDRGPGGGVSGSAVVPARRHVDGIKPDGSHVVRHIDGIELVRQE